MIYIGNNKYKLYVGSTPMKFVDEILPYDVEIEYLKNSGTQYIELPLTANIGQNLSIEGQMMSFDGSTYSFIFGSNPDAQLRAHYYSKNASTMITYASHVGGVATNGGFSNGKPIGEMGYFYLGTDGRSVSGTFKPLSRPLTANVKSFKLFAAYSQPSCTIAFREVQIKVDNIVVYNFIPVRVGQVGYMYDKVSGQLFGNNGTGDFVLGPDKN